MASTTRKTERLSQCTTSCVYVTLFAFFSFSNLYYQKQLHVEVVSHLASSFSLSLINLHPPSFIFHSLQRQDGTIIDNSYERAKPFTFGVALGDVLPGWNEVVKQMSVGDKAECVLPPNLMYSTKGLPGLIEPNMNIHLEVELVSIQTSADTDQGNDKRRRNR